MANVVGNSPTISSNSRKIKTPSATVSRPGSSTPIVITSFAMKDCNAEFNPDAIQMLAPLEYEVIMEELKKRDAIKYAAYRTASKFERLRTALNLDQVKLGAVTSAFNQHGFKTALTDAKFNASKATDVIADIFFSAGKVNFVSSLTFSKYLRTYWGRIFPGVHLTDPCDLVIFLSEIYTNPKGVFTLRLVCTVWIFRVFL